MRIRQIYMMVLLFLGLASVVKAQTYDKLWKQVEQADKKSLPQTVIQLTTEIFQKAEVEMNIPEMLKAYTWRMRYRDELTPDSFYVNLKGLERWLQTAESPLDKAVLHSLIAGIYADYASGNRWQMSQQPDIIGEEPSGDIREWTSNMFVQQVLKHTAEAVKDRELLLKTSSWEYIPFVVQGNASEYFYHDMLHLLGSRGVNALKSVNGMDRDSMVTVEIENTYQSMLQEYKKPGFDDAYVLTMLNYLEWRRSTDRHFQPYRAPEGRLGLTQDPYLAGLDKLKTEFHKKEICADVYLAKAKYAVEKGQPAIALQLCDEGLQTYPRYKRINALRNLKQEILNPYLYVRTDEVVYPGNEFKLTVSHKNLSGFTVRLLKNKKQIAAQHFALLRSENYLQQDTTFTMKAPEIGKYVMQVEPDVKARDKSEHNLAVTRFKVLTLRLPGNQYEAVVLDNVSGQPVEGAILTLYSNDEKELATFTTDAEGKTIFPYMSAYRRLAVQKGMDTAMPMQDIYGGSFGLYNDPKAIDRVTLLTDRVLYRPGQTVYVKGIAYRQREGVANVIEGGDYTLTLTDANWQEVAKKELRTNEFGSFTTSFVLPSACLNGNFTLVTSRGAVTIRVEEYKRPTFDITFNKLNSSYRLGDKVALKGSVKTFSGVALQELPVEYTVERDQFYFFRGTVQRGETIASGKVMLDADGGFSIPVALTGQSDNDKGYYTFRVNATVTNLAGETQTSSFMLSVGERSLLLGADFQNPLCKDDSISMTFTAYNLDREPVAVNGTYKLYLMGTKTAEEALKGTAVYSGTFVSNREAVLPEWTSIPSGKYLLLLSAKDDQGREVTAREEVVLFSMRDTRPPVDTHLWYYGENTSFDAAHPAVFTFGTSRKDAYVMMHVFSGDKQLESKTWQLSDSIVRFEYPYKETYGNGITVNFCFVKDGEVYQRNVKLTKRLPDKTLAIKWDVFRDKLRPGQQEEWKLTIKTPQSMPAVAEMLATMYDASLDKIWKNNQSLSVYYDLFVPSANWMEGYWGMSSFNFWFPYKSLKVEPMEFDRFNIPPFFMGAFEGQLAGVSYNRRSGGANLMVRGMTGSVLMKTASNRAESFELVEQTENSVTESEDSMESEEATSGLGLLEKATGDLRTNFAETAFFYPQLRTNEQGELSFSFTMPQSLTRWNFRGYAHTKEMLTGQIDAEATTSKEFMLTPNMPRFVRVGDRASIAASIVNLTGKNLNGTVSFVLFDPMSEKVISTQKQKFAVEAGKTTGVSFLFTVSDKQDVLGCRMIADGGTFSDGEQRLLPVLTNKANLIETVAMPIRGNQTREFSLDKLFNNHSPSATDRRLTVEFTSNPAWYAVQALPSMSMPENNNAISWAAAYYANTLASWIMNAQPRIKAVFDSWKLQGGTKETFLSNLQKNQELKNILLSESPWVLEAKTEQEQKERIATLFDLNNIRNNNITALTRLSELQQADGSWAWYRGMSGSRYITDFIVGLNARLALLTGKPLEGNALTMQQSAFGYLHKQAVEEFQEIRKSEKNGMKVQGLSAAALDYLYLIAISGEKVPAGSQVAYNYFLSKVGDLLTHASMEQKAFAAIILSKTGQAAKANEFMASLKEHLTTTDEQGMFFAFKENPYSWNGLQIPAHVDVMEAFDQVSGNNTVVEEMKLWLLKQKQTQAWDSPITSADAVYALLMRGTSLLENQGDVRITIASEVLETQSPAKTTVPGLGYIKETFTNKKVVDARKVTVQKRDAGIAWGAVYAQYQEEMSLVKQQGGEMNVEKKLYVERLVNNVRQLLPVTADTRLAVGDKIVSRLTIRLDRPMDFVQLKDQRAACFEPIEMLSGYRWSNGFGYYTDVKDASTNFFFDGLGKGVFILEYSYRVNRSGTYETGLATIQSAYAPEYASHSAAMKVTVK